MSKLYKRICKDCKTENEPENEYCSRCGKSIIINIEIRQSKKADEIEGKSVEKTNATSINNETGNEEIPFDEICSNCEVKVILDVEEEKQGFYICPKCNYKNYTAKIDINRFDKLNGISGWLVPPALGFFSNGGIILSDLKTFLNLGKTIIPNYVSIFGIIKNLFLLTFLIVLSYYFFRKKKQAPKLYINFILCFIILGFVEMILLSNYIQIPDYLTRSITMVGAGIIWISYFSVSERVRKTFIR